MSVKTGKQRGAGTDANVFVKIFGSKGDTGTLKLMSAENSKNKFEAGRIDDFKLESTDIGQVTYLDWMIYLITGNSPDLWRIRLVLIFRFKDQRIGKYQFYFSLKTLLTLFINPYQAHWCQMVTFRNVLRHPGLTYIFNL